MIKLGIFLLILMVGWLVLLLFHRHAQQTGRVSFFGFRPTMKAENPDKFAKIVRSYRLQAFALPVIAVIVVSLMELPQ